MPHYWRAEIGTLSTQAPRPGDATVDPIEGKFEQVRDVTHMGVASVRYSILIESQ